MDEPTTKYQVLPEASLLLQAREAEVGHTADDGPSSQQVDALYELLLPVRDGRNTCTASELWDIFRSATELEMTWLFPESDPIAGPVISVLQQIQTDVGDALCKAIPEQREHLEKFSNLAIVANAANRNLKTNGNRPSWWMFVARSLHKFGLKRPAEAIANTEIERWKNSGKQRDRKV